jgi:type I restriction enzyme S subunit
VWYVTEEDHERWNRRVAPRPRDIILTREAPMGYACQLPEGIAACLTQRLVLIRTDSRFVIPEFLLYYLNSSVFQEQLLNAQRGLTSRHIRVGDLPRFVIPLPPPADQQRIVAFLDQSRTLHMRLRDVLVHRQTMISSLLPSALMQLA